MFEKKNWKFEPGDLKERLLWDQNTQYFFSEKAFILSTLKDTVYGIGFECKEDLSMHLAKKTIGNIMSMNELLTEAFKLYSKITKKI